MVGSLSRAAKQGLKELFLGFVVNNAHAMVTALNRLGFIGEGANLAAIERGVALIMEQYHGMTLGEVRDLNVSEVAREIEDLFYRQPFRVPAQFAFAGRAVGTLSGLATGLAPEFNLVAVAIPYAQRFLGLSRDGATQNVQQLLTQLADAGRIMLTLPASLDRVLTKMEAGDIRVYVTEDSPNGLARFRVGRGLRAAARQGSAALTAIGICAAALAAGVVLMLNDLVVAGWFCFGLASFAALTA